MVLFGMSGPVRDKEVGSPARGGGEERKEDVSEKGTHTNQSICQVPGRINKNSVGADACRPGAEVLGYPDCILLRMKAKKIANIKRGHRQGYVQHELSDRANLGVDSMKRKTNPHTGGGGRIGAGGKKGRPRTGWEKGDVARDMDLESSPFPLKIKSQKRLKAK